MAPRIERSASMLAGMPRSRFRSAVAKVPVADCKRRYSRFMSLPEHQLVKKEPLLWRVVEKELANALLAQQSVESKKPPGVRGSGERFRATSQPRAAVPHRQKSKMLQLVANSKQ